MHAHPQFYYRGAGFIGHGAAFNPALFAVVVTLLLLLAVVLGMSRYRHASR